MFIILGFLGLVIANACGKKSEDPTPTSTEAPATVGSLSMGCEGNPCIGTEAK